MTRLPYIFKKQIEVKDYGFWEEAINKEPGLIDILKKFNYREVKPNTIRNVLCEIKTGLKNGLTFEQVSVYADPKFDNYQMYVIRKALKDNITEDYIKIFAEPQYDDDLMSRIVDAIKANYSEEKIHKFVETPDLLEKEKQMKEKISKRERKERLTQLVEAN